MSDIPTFPYHDLWGERSVGSVANLTRRDGEEFFRIAGQMALEISTERFPVGEANTALSRFRAGEVRGAAVLEG
jgi:propanol-preferring alcohol dehydrogenase